MVSQRFLRPVAALSAILLLASCASEGSQKTASDTAAAASTTATASTAAAASTCVADPAAVIARTGSLPTTLMPDALTATIDAAAQSGLKSAAAPGAIVAVQSKDGFFLKAYGVADPATGAPMTTDMYQRVGSITKPFTGTLVLQLAAAGKLSLDDPISKYVPAVNNGENITLRMLGDMTSGLASYTLDTSFTDKYFAQPEKVWTPDELLSVGLALPPLFAPGAEFNYSNTNTILLGKVIEKVTGQTYQDVLQQKILTPLGLADTSFPAGSATYPSPHPQGFTLQSDKATPTSPVNTTAWNPSWGWTAGEMISTAKDLAVFARAEATGHGLLPAKQQLERLTSSPGAAGYGFAWGCSDG